MGRCKSALSLLAALPAAGCALPAVFQPPLMSDRPAAPAPSDRSLVLGGQGRDGDAAGRRDQAAGVRPNPSHVYYGPGGRLYYQDGSPVEFDSVKKQLQDYRAEERIR